MCFCETFKLMNLFYLCLSKFHIIFLYKMHFISTLTLLQFSGFPTRYHQSVWDTHTVVNTELWADNTPVICACFYFRLNVSKLFPLNVLLYSWSKVSMHKLLKGLWHQKVNFYRKRYFLNWFWHSFHFFEVPNTAWDIEEKQGNFSDS